jgi:hypothetical protein
MKKQTKQLEQANNPPEQPEQPEQQQFKPLSRHLLDAWTEYEALCGNLPWRSGIPSFSSFAGQYEFDKSDFAECFKNSSLYPDESESPDELHLLDLLIGVYRGVKHPANLRYLNFLQIRREELVEQIAPGKKEGNPFSDLKTQMGFWHFTGAYDAIRELDHFRGMGSTEFGRVWATLMNEPYMDAHRKYVKAQHQTEAEAQGYYVNTKSMLEKIEPVLTKLKLQNLAKNPIRKITR